MISVILALEIDTLYCHEGQPSCWYHKQCDDIIRTRKVSHGDGGHGGRGDFLIKRV